MTCAEIREQFSARADDALSAPERAALEGHLATCPECRREWQRFAATVGLLRAVEPARAPAGFVDRVLAGARPQPWYRRLARGLLVPWPVKLPLEAAALVMVAGLAVLVFQRSSDLQLATQAPEPPRETYELRQEGLTARLDQPRKDRKNQDALAPTLADSRDTAAPPAKADSGRPESAPPRLAQQYADEPVAARRQQAAEPGQQSALSAGGVAATAPAESFGEARAKRQETLAKEAERDAMQGLVPSARQRKAEEGEAQLKKLAVRVPPSVELSLAVADRAEAQAVVTAMVERLGGAVVPGAAPAALEIMVPRDAFTTLTSDLARLGTLRVVRQPAELPESVRIGLQLTN